MILPNDIIKVTQDTNNTDTTIKLPTYEYTDIVIEYRNDHTDCTYDDAIEDIGEELDKAMGEIFNPFVLSEIANHLSRVLSIIQIIYPVLSDDQLGSISYIEKMITNIYESIDNPKKKNMKKLYKLFSKEKVFNEIEVFKANSVGIINTLDEINNNKPLNDYISLM